MRALRTFVPAVALGAAMAIGLLGQGCGDDDEGRSVTGFEGNVDGVVGDTASRDAAAGFLRALRSLIAPAAIAQSGCDALQACVQTVTGAGEPRRRCEPVGESCDFLVRLSVVDGVRFFFVCGNGSEAVLVDDLGPVCNGPSAVVHLLDVSVDCALGTASAALLENETCGDQATPTPSATPVDPAATPTVPPTTTPTVLPTPTPDGAATPAATEMPTPTTPASTPTETPTSTPTPTPEGTSTPTPTVTPTPVDCAADTDCGAGFCEDDSSCGARVSGHCYPKIGGGGCCTRNAECISDLCITGTCAPAAAL